MVFAATSLRDVFEQLGGEFQDAHPGVEVIFNFAGTQALRTQLTHGAAADVFASADPQHMQELQRAAEVVEPFVFTCNEPVVVVSKAEAAAIHSLADLPLATRIVLGGPEVPIGRYSEQILDAAARALGSDFKANVQAKVVSYELNVRQVLAKVSLGEAQAGIVYRTDALTALDRVSIVPIDPQLNVVAKYPIAMVAGARHPTLAHAWLQWLRSEQALEALRRAGFATCPSAGNPP